MDRVQGRRLVNLSEHDLNVRLAHIERNIQLLDPGAPPVMACRRNAAGSAPGGGFAFAIGL